MTESQQLVITPRLTIPLAELEFSYSRSSGPGGQNVNKVNSKATLRWAVRSSLSLPPDVRERFLVRYASRLTNDGEILITGQQFRDQGQNTDDCLEKLRQMLLAVAVPPKKRRPTKPTRGSKERRLQGKKQTADRKQLRRGPPRSD